MITKDRKQIHKDFCDYEIRKSSVRRYYGGSLIQKPKDNGIRRNGYTNYELKEIFSKMA